MFVFDREILDPLLARGLAADRRVEFILASLAPLDAALRAAGGGLIVLHDHARKAVPALAAELGAESRVSPTTTMNPPRRPAMPRVRQTLARTSPAPSSPSRIR
ncbi:deoxyribodipyrimidine photo-lyase [Cupriavidus basilensis]